MVDLNLISVFLSAASLLQGAKQKQDSRERSRVVVVCEVLNELDKFFMLLDEAKRIHDSFETFSNSGMDPFYKSTQNGFANNDEALNHVDSFKGCVLRYLSEFDSFAPQINAELKDIDKIPAHLVWEVRTLVTRIPVLRERLSGFRKAEQDIISFSNEKSYGDPFKVAVLKAYDQANEITVAADKIILNSVPIIGYMQGEIRKLLEVEK